MRDDRSRSRRAASPVSSSATTPRCGPSPTALRSSTRPALVVGPGVDRDGAWDVTVELAERSGALVWVSPLSSRCSFPEDHPAFAGFLTPQRSTLARQLAGHDLVVVLGAPVFTYHVHADGPVPRRRHHAVPARRRPAGRGHGAGRDRRAHDAAGRRARAARPPRAGAADPRPRGTGTAGGAAGERADLGCVRDAHRGAADAADAVIVEEAPSHRNAMHDHLPIRTSGGFYCAASGGLGFGLPAAVGVALGDPTRRVICLLGDGSSLYSIQALWTAAQHDLPIAFVILNNRGYGALKALGRAWPSTSHRASTCPGIGFAELAAGFGCAARAVTRADELEAALRLGARQCRADVDRRRRRRVDGTSVLATDP